MAPLSEPTMRCLLFRRAAFVEGLGFNDELSPDGAAWNLLLQLQDLKWKSLACPEVLVETKSFLKNRELSATDIPFLKKRWPDYAKLIANLAGVDTACPSPVAAIAPAATAVALTPTENIKVDWIGSFLDYGSLSQVNRECTQALTANHGFQIKRIANAATKDRIGSRATPRLRPHTFCCRFTRCRRDGSPSMAARLEPPKTWRACRHSTLGIRRAPGGLGQSRRRRG